MADGLPGAWSDPREPDGVQEICDQVKALVEQKTNKIYVEVRAVEFRIQIVAGTNFLIKVDVGGENYIHLLVFKALPCNGGGIELLKVLEDKTKEEPLVPF
ncbi:leukocyte cysteine proteinase inhibitor 1-like isoform X1 [Morone saxatilis]|uniref:leukocyte cysteine proteinase inhibitor 1-like isoform X1 n=1 Tax=Morone saxatilis TaxID=34816 RepID=UPI0015E1FB1D|nr:leukocyte cysteine proteinase inhibitor 1-like isoform X1 [Morone saxatilis]